jgi:hypothetical protein
LQGQLQEDEGKSWKSGTWVLCRTNRFSFLQERISLKQKDLGDMFDSLKWIFP